MSNLTLEMTGFLLVLKRILARLLEVKPLSATVSSTSLSEAVCPCNSRNYAMSPWNFFSDNTKYWPFCSSLMQAAVTDTYLSWEHYHNISSLSSSSQVWRGSGDAMFCYCVINWKSHAMTYYRQDKAVTGKQFFTIIPARPHTLKLHTPLQATPPAQTHYISLYK